MTLGFNTSAGLNWRARLAQFKFQGPSFLRSHPLWINACFHLSLWDKTGSGLLQVSAMTLTD